MQDEQPRVIPAGGYWLGVVPSGRILRLTDAHGNQAADTLFFNADDFSERYSAMQTVQAQRAVYLTTGSILLSEQGRPMAEIIEDTCGRHDTLGGACAAEPRLGSRDADTLTWSCSFSGRTILGHRYGDLVLWESGAIWARDSIA